jgi:hypothetical protein
MDIFIAASYTLRANKNALVVVKVVGVCGLNRHPAAEVSRVCVVWPVTWAHPAQFDECMARTMAGFWSYAKSTRVNLIGREEGRAGDGVGDENQCGCVTQSFCLLVVACVMRVLGRGVKVLTAAQRVSRKEALR